MDWTFLCFDVGKTKAFVCYKNRIHCTRETIQLGLMLK